jgi:hypothetical protein
MNTHDTLYFPSTAVFSGSQYPIYLLFEKLHILQPIEAEETDTTVAADLFINNGFCQAHTPCPLGDNRKRFLHLIGDIKNRKDDYAAQLSSLTMAAMSAPQHKDDDTTQEIISSLLGTQGIKDQEEREEAIAVALWQARLVLKIAEILDQEEEEIAEQLALLDDREADLFRQLHGEDTENHEEEDILRELLELRDKINHPSASVIRNRFRAWKQLFVAGDLPDWPVWTTSFSEAADILLEQYEAMQGRPALEIGQFALPASIGRQQQEALERITSFRSNNADLLARVASDLTAVVSMRQDEDEAQFPREGAVVSGEWAEIMDKNFPAEIFGRTLVTAYLLPGQSFSSILGKNKIADTGDNGLLLVIG